MMKYIRWIKGDLTPPDAVAANHISSVYLIGRGLYQLVVLHDTQYYFFIFHFSFFIFHFSFFIFHFSFFIFHFSFFIFHFSAEG